MQKSASVAIVCALALAAPAGASAQEGPQPGDPMRIAILVDNSQTPLEPLPQIRRGLQQFVNALPDGPVRFHFPGPTLAEDLRLAEPQD